MFLGLKDAIELWDTACLGVESCNWAENILEKLIKYEKHAVIKHEAATRTCSLWGEGVIYW